MTESKSRYGIIDELIEKKNDLITQIANTEQHVNGMELTQKRWLEDHAAEKNRALNDINAMKKQMKNLDEAVTALKDISRESKKE